MNSGNNHNKKKKPDWSQLPDDVKALIFEKWQNFCDCGNFRSICRSWRRSSCTPRYGNRLLPPFPGVLVSNYDGLIDTTTRFMTFKHDNYLYAHINHPLPVLPLPERDQFWLIGSNEGWLVVVEPQSSSIYLTNPFTGAEVQLPCIRTTPHWSERPFPWAFNVQKAVLSGSPRTCCSSSTTEASPCYVMIVFRNWRIVPFCKIGDKAWNCIEVPCNNDYKQGNSREYIELSDAVYCQGMFYILSNKLGKLYAFDLCCSWPKLYEIVSFLPQHLPDCQDGKYNLAELEGQLLLIFRYCKIETLKFEVYKRDIQNNNWIATTSLGEYALFLGSHQSFYTSELNVAGIKANCIYFLHPSYYFPYLEIFWLEDSRIEQLNFNVIPRSAFWFTPAPWDLKEKDAEHRLHQPIHKNCLTAADDDQNKGTEDFRPAICNKKKNTKRSKKNETKKEEQSS